MLRYLTHKLRTQSLNEEQNFDKAQDDHDSGTESDDESGDTNDFPGEHSTMEHEDELEWGESRSSAIFSLNSMGRPRSTNSCEDGSSDMMLGTNGGRDSASSQFESCYNIDSALPSDSDHAYDHHSSEEELEVINNSYQEVEDLQSDTLLLGDDEVRGPGSENKRKWSQVASNRLSVESTSSSDDEVQGLLRPVSTPVEFCTSPPVDAHKPSRSQSPPPKLFLFSAATEDGNEVSSSTGHAVAVVSSGPGALMNGCGGGVFRGLRRCDQLQNAATSFHHHHHHHHNHHTNITTSTNSHQNQNGDTSALGEHQNDRSHLSNATTTSSSSLLSSATSNNTATFTAAASGLGLGGGRSSRSGSGRDAPHRKRHRHNPRHIQRPWLDFEKMQQAFITRNFVTSDVNFTKFSGKSEWNCSFSYYY
jgi:hypothetical protein